MRVLNRLDISGSLGLGSTSKDTFRIGSSDLENNNILTDNLEVWANTDFKNDVTLGSSSVDIIYVSGTLVNEGGASLTGSFKGNGSQLTNLTSSNIDNFAADVRSKFTAGENINISIGLAPGIISSTTQTSGNLSGNGTAATPVILKDNINLTSVSASFSGSGALINNITASNINNFNTDVRDVFLAGDNVTINQVGSKYAISASAAGPGGTIYTEGNITGSGEISNKIRTKDDVTFTTVTASYYTGSSANLDYVYFTDQASDPTQVNGALWHRVDSDYNELRLWTEVPGVHIKLGQQVVVRVHNGTGSPITKGSVVHLTGAVSPAVPRIAKADWTNDYLSANTLGVLNSTLNNGDEGYVVISGLIEGVDTNAFAEGDVLYLSGSGGISNVKAVAPNHLVIVGQVIRVGNSSVGSIFVKIQNGYEIGELHDVIDSSPQNYDLLVRDTDGLWKNTKNLSGSYTLNSVSSSNGFYTSGSGNNIFDVSSSNSALRVTQRGLGDAVRIEDTTNPDATPFIIDAAGNVMIGLTFSTAKLSVNGSFSQGTNMGSGNGSNAHAEGDGTLATNWAAHAEGYVTRATQFYAHAEGSGTLASATASHAEGQWTTASANYSHAEGLWTIASAGHQHAQGKYNATSSTALMIVGNGTADNARSNILEVYTGSVVVSGSLAVSSSLTASNGFYTSGSSNTSIFDVSSSVNDPAFRITQRGAGAAFIVEDTLNPDGDAFVVNAQGAVGIGYPNGFSNPNNYKLLISGGDIFISTNIQLGNALIYGLRTSGPQVTASVGVNSPLYTGSATSRVVVNEVTASAYSGGTFNGSIINANQISSSQGVSGSYLYGDGTFITNLPVGTIFVGGNITGSGTSISPLGTNINSVFTTLTASTGFSGSGENITNLTGSSANFPNFTSDVRNQLSAGSNLDYSAGQFSLSANPSVTTLTASVSVSASNFYGNGSTLDGVVTTLTTNNTSGSATLIGSTLNIPKYIDENIPEYIFSSELSRGYIAVPNSTAFTSYGMPAIANFDTIRAKTPISGSAYSSITTTQFYRVTVSDGICGFRSSVNSMLYNNYSGLKFYIGYAPTDGESSGDTSNTTKNSAASQFIGLCTASAGALATIQNPSNLLNIIGFGSDSTDDYWYFMHNDGTGTATKILLEATPGAGGASFGQANKASGQAFTDFFIFEIYNPPKSTVVYYYAKSLQNHVIVTGSVNTDLPSNSILLGPQACRRSGGGSTQVSFRVSRMGCTNL